MNWTMDNVDNVANLIPIKYEIIELECVQKIENCMYLFFVLDQCLRAFLR